MFKAKTQEAVLSVEAWVHQKLKRDEIDDQLAAKAAVPLPLLDQMIQWKAEGFPVITSALKILAGKTLFKAQLKQRQETNPRVAVWAHEKLQKDQTEDRRIAITGVPVQPSAQRIVAFKVWLKENHVTNPGVKV